jgi:hypothetical protein
MLPSMNLTEQAYPDEFLAVGNELLSLIEIDEARLLNWGFIHGSLDLRTHLPILLGKLPKPAQRTWMLLSSQGVSDEDVLDSLAKRRLIFRLEDGTYRSRFAETVRLLYLLRQRFSHLDWAIASRLVSDLRLELRRRTYPARTISIEDLNVLLQGLPLAPLQLAVIHELMRNQAGQILRLARFQSDAIVRQLANLSQSRDRGLVIGAGTGAGKTKAFYIPAFAHIANAIDPQRPTLQVLAIYPRNELLKDQLAEAFAEARKLDGLLIEDGKRPITMGAYFGDTPESAESLLRYGSWPLSDDQRGYICPFFTCPTDPNHSLVWEKGDLEAEKADNQRGRYGTYSRLRCTSCDHETVPGQLALTRQQMRQSPPDILFTSTEMLNRRLSSTADFALFGIGQSKPPRLMLLDEIHTYEGITGSQIAYLLRRWRHARGYRAGQNLCIVGLSATLSSASQFFTGLTGIPEHDIDYLTPSDDDLVEEGMEYNVVVKGDPVSGTSLLGTSIQTAMLLGRTLDPLHQTHSNLAYGQRIFAFTDKLDVINRWYQSMYDAEFNKRLSKYRLPNPEGVPTLSMRKAHGQIWDMCQRIGHDLNQPLPMSRTTSQDPGVSANTSLVIATSTLEVGFNDPRVGAVLQHKAPRSMASFLQRKGRAGRVRGMRPWTVVVTSAYGRDRWAFQHAEALFNPVLPPIDLPIENYYVRKIQAAFTLLDWAAMRLQEPNQPIYIWQLLSTGSAGEKSNTHQRNRRKLHDLLLGVLTGNQRQDFEGYLRNALGMESTESTFHNLLWGEPRALYYEVIPTLLRQLETNWTKRTPQGDVTPWDDHTAAYPMPDFVPPTLFGDLNLPEVQLRLPKSENRTPNNEESDTRSMAIGQAMSEFAPGRANKRYVTQYRRDVAHWLALPDAAQLTRGVLNLEFLQIQFDEAPLVVSYRGDNYKIYRPRIYTLNELPKGIRSTAYAEMSWRTKIDAPSRQIATAPVYNPVSQRSPWSSLILNMESYNQANGSCVHVTRFAVGVNIDLRYKTGETDRRNLMFENIAGESNTGIGFMVAADALKFSLAPLDTDELRTTKDWSDLYQHLGTAFFRHRLLNDSRLYEANLSSFTIEWLWQLEISMLTATAIARNCTLAEAVQEVNANRRNFADRTLRVIFQSQLSRNEQTLDDADDPEFVGKLHSQLLDYMENDAVVASLNAASSALWDQHMSGFDEWLIECYTSSLGATLLAALTRLVPDIDPDSLALDIDGYNVWISETTAGGVGHVSKLTSVITQHPRRFELQLDDVVRHCERATVAHHLHSTTRLIAEEDSALLDTFAAIRSTTDLPSLLTIKSRLDQTLQNHGVPPTRSVLVALNTKFLRPNSGPDSDSLVVSLIENWEQQAARLGVAIDLRVMAVAACRIPALATQVKEVSRRIDPSQTVDEYQMFNLLQSLLWLTCHDSCPECIETWQPYQKLIFPSRALVAALLSPEQGTVEFGTAEWLADATQSLITNFQVQIRCTSAQKNELKRALTHLLTLPLESGYQNFYPIVERIFQQDGRWIVHLTISELIDV